MSERVANLLYWLFVTLVAGVWCLMLWACRW